MFDKLARLSLLSKVANISMYNKTFNTNLPVLLQVIDKTETGYLLRLGSNVIDAKSVEYLTIGSKYWGILNENSNGLLISNLIKQPKIVDEISKSPILFDISKLELNVDGDNINISQLNGENRRERK